LYTVVTRRKEKKLGDSYGGVVFKGWGGGSRNYPRVDRSPKFSVTTVAKELKTQKDRLRQRGGSKPYHFKKEHGETGKRRKEKGGDRAITNV